MNLTNTDMCIILILNSQELTHRFGLGIFCFRQLPSETIFYGNNSQLTDFLHCTSVRTVNILGRNRQIPKYISGTE